MKYWKIFTLIFVPLYPKNYKSFLDKANDNGRTGIWKDLVGQ